MKIVLLCGNKSNQNALAIKVKQGFNLVGIVKEERSVKHPSSISYLLSKIADRTLFFKIGSSWQHMLGYYRKNYSPVTGVHEVLTDDINSQEVIDFIHQLQPDLIMVSGTSMIKARLLELRPSKGIINLHTGLSPYVKGGPNCTNWCIANNTLHLIGNTIMWIDKGIDSGNIITTEMVPFDGDESLDALHLKVMEHAHQLYLRTLNRLEHDFQNCPSVKQDQLAKGKLYLTRMWNMNAKIRFAYNLFFLKRKLQSAVLKKQQLQPEEIKLVSFPE